MICGYKSADVKTYLHEYFRYAIGVTVFVGEFKSYTTSDGATRSFTMVVLRSGGGIKQRRAALSDGI